MAFEFDRYINGQLMAEGVTIERQGNLPDAMREAARIASRGPNGEVPVLVLRAESLSRTGAVKVGLEQAAAIILAQIDSHPDWTPEQEAELRAHDPVATARSAARVAIKQCHRAILSALESAAPEGAKEELQLRVRLAVVAKYAEIDCPPLALHILNQFADAALKAEMEAGRHD